MWSYEQFIKFLKDLRGKKIPKNVETLPGQINLGLIGQIAQEMSWRQQKTDHRERGRVIHIGGNFLQRKILIDNQDTLGSEREVSLSWYQDSLSGLTVIEEIIIQANNHKRQSIGNIHTHMDFKPFSPQDIIQLLDKDAPILPKFKILANANALFLIIRTSLTPKFSKTAVGLVEKAWDKDLQTRIWTNDRHHDAVQFDALAENCRRWNIALYFTPLKEGSTIVKKITA
ncbi:MAG: hypothetical protein WC310_03865 [Patescibacteria group bacterium]|jgi:hypothetical protein